MRKNYLFVIALLSTFFSHQLFSQAVDYDAHWPNSDWTLNYIHSSYDNPTTFRQSGIEYNPTVDSNFAYYDAHYYSQSLVNQAKLDTIAVESPVIDLTSAHIANQNNIIVTGSYVYENILPNEYLALQYWNADNQIWITFYQFANEDTERIVPDNVCTGNSIHYAAMLNISNFTSSQLTGFKYRIYYNDADYGSHYDESEYMFSGRYCFSSPHLFSTNLEVPNFLTGINSDCTNDQFTIDMNIANANSTSTYTITDNQGSISQIVTSSSNIINLGPYQNGDDIVITITNNQNNDIIVQKRFRNVCTPANDECINAEILTVNPGINATQVTHGTTVGATPSVINGMPFEQVDVWYKFTATSTYHLLIINNKIRKSGLSGNLYAEIYDGTNGCNGLNNPYLLAASCSRNLYNFVVGKVYYVRVSSGKGLQHAEYDFDISIVSLSSNPPVNDECSGAIPLTNSPVLVESYLSTVSAPNDGSEFSRLNISDIWFSAITNANGSLELSINGMIHGYDCFYISIYDGVYPGNGVSLLDQREDICQVNPTINFSNLPANQLVYLRLGGLYCNHYYSVSLNRTSAIINEDINETGLKFFPNPIKDRLKIQTQEKVESLIMMNTLGQQVLSITPNSNNFFIDVKFLPAGYYMVKAIVNRDPVYFKVIKE